jgi:hypothetical protein
MRLTAMAVPADDAGRVQEAKARGLDASATSGS